MAQNVHKVNIGGLDYRLTSDNEALLRKTVELVNLELDNLQAQSDVKLPITQHYVLLALNLAERLITIQENYEIEIETLKSELIKINDFIENTI